VTAIAEGAVNFIDSLLALVLDSTVRSVENLCIVQSSCFLDLIANKLKCVHWITPKEMRMLIPVPSVVCVLAIKTMRICMIHPMHKKIKLLCSGEQLSFLKTLPQPFIVFTSEEILRWDVTKKD